MSRGPPQALRHIIKPPVQDPRGFLQQHVHSDLQQLTKTLGRSADETATVVHLVLCSLLRGQRHLSSWGERGAGGGGARARQIRGSREKCADEHTGGQLVLAFPLLGQDL